MTERLDLSNKLREPLQDWQFTPAMQQRVLARIKEPVTPVARRTGPSLKTLAWTAAAAAVFVIGINVAPSIMDKGLEGDRMQAMESAPGQAAGAQESMAPAIAAVPSDTEGGVSALQAGDPMAGKMGIGIMAAPGQQLTRPVVTGQFAPVAESKAAAGSMGLRSANDQTQSVQALQLPGTTSEAFASDTRPAAPLAPEAIIRWDAWQVEAFRAADESYLWSIQMPDGLILQTVTTQGDRMAILATDEAGAAIWVLNGEAEAVYEASFAEQITDLAFTAEGELMITLPDGTLGLIQVNP